MPFGADPPFPQTAPPGPAGTLSREHSMKLQAPMTVERETAYDEGQLEQWRSRVQGQTPPAD